MSKLLANILAWITNKFLIFLFVLALLVSFQLLKEQYQVYLKDDAEVIRLEQEVQIRTDKIVNLTKGLSAKVKKKYSVYDKKIKNSKKSIKKWKKEISNLRKKDPIKKLVPFSKTAKKILALKLKIKAAEKSIKTWNKAKKKLAQEHSKGIEKLQMEITILERELDQTREDQEGNFLNWAFKQFDQHLSSAMAIVLGLIMVPVLIKLLFYFVLAPLASKCKPIQLLPGSEGLEEDAPQERRGNISSRSLEVVLAKHKELIVLPEYVNSLTTDVSAETQYFLSSSLPFSSIASGLFMLTRIVSNDVNTIFLSSSRQPLIDLGIIELKEQMSVVCFPRSLAGIIKNVDTKFNMTRHWRLNSLQAWLTLQLRYLVIHGPCEIIVKGCRGVRVEDAGQGRMINQAATLGFSANLKYRNSRCETFIPYWTGASDLLNDLFDGDNGFFFYEEMPDQNRKTGITGRGLEGFTDSVLKIFGI